MGMGMGMKKPTTGAMSSSVALKAAVMIAATVLCCKSRPSSW